MYRTTTHERGVVLIYTLIILLILTIGAVALVRSMHTSLFSAGNLGFRRDLVNQGEQAVANVITQFKTGAFVAPNATENSNVALNYSATALPNNPQGVPTALFNDGAFTAVATHANDIVGATPDVIISYVIDRLCNTTGPSNGLICVQSTALPGDISPPGNGLPPPASTVYRLSVRVSGARSTQVFLQSTFTKPD